MTKIVLEQLVWDDFNHEHIKKHHVAIKEIEQALKHLLVHRKGHNKKIVLIGRAGKRLIAMVLGHEKGNTYYAVSVRDADRKERKLVYEKEGKNKNS